MSDNPGKPTEPWTNSGNQSQTELIYAGILAKSIGDSYRHDCSLYCVIPILLSIYPDFLESKHLYRAPRNFCCLG